MSDHGPPDSEVDGTEVPALTDQGGVPRPGSSVRPGGAVIMDLLLVDVSRKWQTGKAARCQAPTSLAVAVVLEQGRRFLVEQRADANFR